VTRIAIATCGDEWVRDLPEDLLLVDALRGLGADVERWAWDDPSAGWDAVDLVVVRSTWDYHRRLPEFLDWVDRVARSVMVVNPAHLLRWNSHKSYLLDLAAAGLAVVPTRLVVAGAPGDLEAIMVEEGWDEVVVKPAVSASAEGAVLVRRGGVAKGSAHLEALSDRDMLVQPFLGGVADPGEVSVVVIGGAASHAVRKRPATGDFRVQEHFGGSVDVVDGGSWHDAALRAVAAAPGLPVFARVDLVPERDVLLVAELELIEPSLFLDLVPGSADRLAAALVRNAPSDRSNRGTN
jgi:glutathione synthase/RimK-type ligase-like ATP-grasp enzyme